MKTIHALSVFAFSVLPLSCATAKPPVELDNARQAYRNVEVDARRTAPAELHDARVALDAAEAVFAREPDGLEVKDRAYIAQRKAEIAGARHAVAAAIERRDAANTRLRALGAAAVTELAATRSDLSDAEKKARTVAQDVSNLRQDLRGATSSLKDEQARVRDEQENVRTEQENVRAEQARGTELTAELAAEREARKLAEQKLTSTLQAMRDLQSVKEEPRGLVITLSGSVLFASGQWVLLPAAQTALNNVAEALKATPERAIVIEGHTDSQGGAASNQELSQRRSEAVRDYLVSRGIAAAGVRATGFGQDKPVADNATAEGRANNRRVEIVLTPAPERR